MKQETSRAIAKNLVIVATMGLAIAASWAVTGARQPAIHMGTTIDLGTVNACSAGQTAARIRGQCKTGGQQG